MCSLNANVLLCGSSVLVCSLSPQLHMLFPPGWRLGLTAKGGGGMGGKARGGGQRGRTGNIPPSRGVGGRRGSCLQGPEKPKGKTKEGV